MKISASGSSQFIDISEVGPADGLVAWYPLQGDTKDYADGIDGVNNGATPTVRGYNFNGTTSRVSTPNDALQFRSGDPFSLSAWININSVGGSTNVVMSYALSGRGWYLTHDRNLIRTNSFFFDYYDGSIFRGIQGLAETIPTGQWVHLVATSKDNTVFSMKVFVNGSIAPYTNRGSGTPNDINYDNLFFSIGSRELGGLFTGNISDVRIYNRALSAEEVSILYEITNPELNNRMKQSKDCVYIRGEFQEA